MTDNGSNSVKAFGADSASVDLEAHQSASGAEVEDHNVCEDFQGLVVTPHEADDGLGAPETEVGDAVEGSALGSDSTAFGRHRSGELNVCNSSKHVKITDFRSVAASLSIIPASSDQCHFEARPFG